MCGICGVYHRCGERLVDEDLLRAMVAVMTHRGPDDDGFYLHGSVGLGMRRLSIIDLDGGAQPISSEDGRVVTVFNGEIYNFKELRRELESRGHSFRTLTDTEVIVHAYEEWGLAALSRFNGMFGLAIWDEGTRTLVLARDPYGIKPLYYRDAEGSVAFASELKSILCDDSVPREVDPVGLDLYLSLTFVPSPRTAFKGIYKVPPGYALICEPGSSRLHRFHKVVPQSLNRATEAEIVSELQDRIEAAVRRQMVADVPVGILLSGGVDSTTTATIMSGIADHPIDTFTVGFTGAHALNELAYARETANRLGTRHHEILVSADDYADFLPRAAWYLEEPVAMDSTLAYHEVCALARTHVKVVLTGQGADEPFAGYRRHLGERYGWLYRALPASVQGRLLPAAVSRLPRNERAKRAVRSLGAHDALERMAAVWTVFDNDLRQRLYPLDTSPRAAVAGAAAMWQADVAHLDGLSQMLYVDARMTLADNLLTYGDKMAMAVSLEARVPFLDLELMRFAETIPPSLKIRGRTHKYVLRRAMAKWLPPEILARKKIGFTPPIDLWLRGDLKSYVSDLLLHSGSACTSFFDASVVKEMITDHATGREDYKRPLLSLVEFELWHDQYIRPSHVAWRAASSPSSGRRAPEDAVQ